MSSETSLFLTQSTTPTQSRQAHRMSKWCIAKTPPLPCLTAVEIMYANGTQQNGKQTSHTTALACAPRRKHAVECHTRTCRILVWRRKCHLKFISAIRALHRVHRLLRSKLFSASWALIIIHDFLNLSMFLLVDFAKNFTNLLSGFTIRRKISKKVKFPNHFPPPIFPPHTHSTRGSLHTRTSHFPSHTTQRNQLPHTAQLPHAPYTRTSGTHCGDTTTLSADRRIRSSVSGYQHTSHLRGSQPSHITPPT